MLFSQIPLEPSIASPLRDHAIAGFISQIAIRDESICIPWIDELPVEIGESDRCVHWTAMRLNGFIFGGPGMNQTTWTGWSTPGSMGWKMRDCEDQVFERMGNWQAIQNQMNQPKCILQPGIIEHVMILPITYTFFWNWLSWKTRGTPILTKFGHDNMVFLCQTGLSIAFPTLFPAESSFPKSAFWLPGSWTHPPRLSALLAPAVALFNVFAHCSFAGDSSRRILFIPILCDLGLREWFKSFSSLDLKFILNAVCDSFHFAILNLLSPSPFVWTLSIVIIWSQIEWSQIRRPCKCFHIYNHIYDKLDKNSRIQIVEERDQWTQLDDMPITESMTEFRFITYHMVSSCS
jgi:hypothetical protein